MTRPFAPWPSFTSEEIEAATRVLRSGKVNYWTGVEGRLFEKEYAAFVGRKYAVALANGTVALELALAALGIGEGDDVVVTPRTFVASAFCAMLRGARPVFADVDPDSGGITAESIRAVLTPRTKAVIPVHLGGWPCDMEAIGALAREKGLFVIEDCAQAHGATWRGRPVGAFGDVACFSFCQDKIITTAGEGGMLLTDREDVWRKAWSFKDHGKDWDAVYVKQHPPGFRWLHESPGTNWRMTEVQSAVGRVALRRLGESVGLRRRNAGALDEGLARIPGVRVVKPPSHAGHAYYKYHFFVEPGALKDGWTRDRVMVEVGAEGIPCFSGSCSEIYLEKAFEGLRPSERLPVAKRLGDTSLMLLVHPTLTAEDMGVARDAVARVMQRAVR
jgi:hypothetical protein